jgi:uncharacterized membrane protein
MEGLIVVALIVIGAIVLGFVAFVMVMNQRGRLAALTSRLEASIAATEALAREVRILQAQGIAPSPPPPPVAPAISSVPEVIPSPEPSPIEVVTADPLEPVVEPIAAVAMPDPVQVRARESLEEKLANRWMLWAGAVALALAGVFLVKFAIDQGWFGPTTRTAAGFLAGCALMVGGEWLRRRPPQRAVAAVRINPTFPIYPAELGTLRGG